MPLFKSSKLPVIKRILSATIFILIAGNLIPFACNVIPFAGNVVPVACNVIPVACNVIPVACNFIPVEGNFTFHSTGKPIFTYQSMLFLKISIKQPEKFKP